MELKSLSPSFWKERRHEFTDHDFGLGVSVKQGDGINAHLSSLSWRRSTLRPLFLQVQDMRVEHWGGRTLIHFHQRLLHLSSHVAYPMIFPVIVGRLHEHM